LSSPARGHWLEVVAAHAGLKLALPNPSTVGDIARAWPRVVEACGISEEAFTQRVAGHFRVGIADLTAYDPQATKLIPEDLARRFGILAIRATDETVVVATSDPSTPDTRREITACASRQPVFVVASPTKLAQAIERAYAPARVPRNALQTLVAEVAAGDFQVISVQGHVLTTSFDLDDPALVRLTTFVLQQAIRYRATEIHVEPGGEQGRVRYRIDGVMQQVVDLPIAAQTRLIARLKHLARTQAHGKPEDGFVIRLDAVERRARLMTTDSPGGELVLIRLVEPGKVPTLEDLGFDFIEGDAIRRVLQRADGLVLVTGPARSGTSSFIYAALDCLKTKSVISLESRPEIDVPGVTQVRFDPAAGPSFAEMLQELMNRSPDVLHAGEVRDLATARIVLRIAVTGRKVIATMHTPDAVSGVRRLVEMGLAPGRFAESLQAVISLRLVRRLCECSRPFDPRRDAKMREAVLAGLLGVVPVRCAVGCQRCARTGYLGQIPIPEILVVSAALREVLAAGPPDAELLRAARADGMRTFVEVALGRVSKGDTTVEEVERVLGVAPPRHEAAGKLGPVLVVEDVPEDRLLLTEVLREMGFRVMEANDARAALALLKSGESFSLALIDLYLPEMDGLDLLRYIRRSLTTQSLPAIVVTGSADPRHELDLLNAGADDYLLKPVVPGRFKARVRAVLRRAGVRLAGEDED
jgi:type IV pilus assembly protein PilB